MGKLTMHDIAKMAGVSRPVVSAVLGGKTTCRVSEEKRELILELVEKYKYSPDLSAQALRSGKARTIGILYHSFRDQVIGTLILEFYRNLLKKGYTSLFLLWESLDEVHLAYEQANRLRLDGILTSDYHPELLNQNIPVVLYGNHRKGIDGISINYNPAFNEALAYLQELGHKKIGFIGPETPRFEAFAKAMDSAGLEPVAAKRFTPNPNFNEIGTHAAREFLSRKERPTALICHNDIVAYAAMTEAQRMGLSVGKDVSFIGIDNVDISRITYPSLTTMDTSIQEKAVTMVDMLLNRLAHPDLPVKHITLDAKLVIRDSCGAPVRKPGGKKK